MNDIMRKIQRTIVDTEISKIKSSAIGYVTAVHHEEQTADVLLVEKDGMKRRRNRLPFPKTGTGVVSQSLKPGDRVEIGYRNNSYHTCYIVQLYKGGRGELSTTHGQSLPFSTDLF